MKICGLSFAERLQKQIIIKIKYKNSCNNYLKKYIYKYSEYKKILVS